MCMWHQVKNSLIHRSSSKLNCPSIQCRSRMHNAQACRLHTGFFFSTNPNDFQSTWMNRFWEEVDLAFGIPIFSMRHVSKSRDNMAGTRAPWNCKTASVWKCILEVWMQTCPALNAIVKRVWYKQARKNISSCGCSAEPASVPRPWLALCEDGGLGAAGHALKRLVFFGGDLDGSLWHGY